MTSEAAGDPVAHLREVRSLIDRAARDFGRDPKSVRLVCVAKTVSAERIRPVIEAGERIFGENRVQEAQGKWPALRADRRDLQLHLIGPLQTNKAREAVALFDVIETLDRPSLARTLAAEIQRAGRAPKLFCQVNTGAEPQKAGLLPQDADAFILQCRTEYGLEPSGLMCIPPIDEQASPHFALLAKIAARNGLPELSMGMSADYELAIQLGATYVRIGSAIFGARG
ncbi:MAG: YggS family pyridoxal phosphate-dependent enzyme [Methylobacteriaceae bacterium]|nr:YggS family pyridoxal phosphate-dependent enzyme [Methylobacteriaceae bacterium]